MTYADYQTANRTFIYADLTMKQSKTIQSLAGDDVSIQILSAKTYLTILEILTRN